MKLNKLWLESIGHLPSDIQESLILEQPHTRFVEPIPRTLNLDWLCTKGSVTDLGFENLGLSPEAYRSLGRAFAGPGVAIPNTDWKIRVSRPMDTVVEPVEGGELALPSNWVEGVLTIADDNRVLFIGKRVRPDQVGEVDWDGYSIHATEWGLGWILKNLDGVPPVVA